MIPENKSTISILGCGWYGLHVAKSLVDSGYQVSGSTTSPEKLSVLQSQGITPFLLNFDAQEAAFDASFFDSDILIISLPPKRHAGEHGEYPDKIRKIAEAAERGSVKSVLMISSTSVYADVNRELAEEEVPVPDTVSGEAIFEAEELLRKCTSFRTTILRFGGLIGPGRNLAKFFAGKTDIANGLAPVNLLHLEDCIKITHHILDHDAFGYTYNACSPDHPTRKDVYTLAASITGLASPVFIPELTKWKLINGNFVTKHLKYKYLVNNWSEFLNPDKL